MKYKEVSFTEFCEGKTQVQAAEALGITQGAVREKLAKAADGADERVYTIGSVPVWRVTIKKTPIIDDYREPNIKGS